MNEHEKETDPGQIILIDKPLQWTSFDIVKKIRNVLHIKKAGHAGTLDPLATGLLIICTGRKTKEIGSFQELQKEYEGTFMLGEIRPSYDRETQVIEQRDISGITEEKLRQAASSFQGELLQVPPAYSAIKKEGKPAYKLARKGTEFKLEARAVVIYNFDITGVEFPLVHFKLTCSKGFYVRALARDLGEMLGCGACLYALRRTKIGDYSVENALTISQLKPKSDYENI